MTAGAEKYGRNMGVTVGEYPRRIKAPRRRLTCAHRDAAPALLARIRGHGSMEKKTSVSARQRKKKAA